MASRINKRKKNKTIPWWSSWWFNWIFRLSVLAVLIVPAFIGLVNVGAFGELPDQEVLSKIRNANASQVYSSDGALMGQFYLVNRSEITWEQVPQHLLDALVATEDVRFYEHEGLDPRSIARVFFKTLLFQSRSGGGGSTLTQQLAKNLFPRQSHPFLSTVINKIKEWIIAHRLEGVYSKEEILGLYLNTVPFGENVYGIEAASLRYFGIPASQMDIQQGAVLVGMLKANHTYNPRLFPESSLGRRNVVLGQMAKYGYLEETAADSITRLPLKLNYSRLTSDPGIAPYFLDRVRNEVLHILDQDMEGSRYDLLSDGLKIETTIDSRLQAMAEQGTREHMQELQASFDQHWSSREPWDQNPDILNDAIKRSPQYKHLELEGYDHQQILEQLKILHKIELFHWGGSASAEISTLDSIKYNLMLLQMGFLALEPFNGHIKVWIGGIDHRFFKYDHVKNTTKRQVGSTFKPFVYATALERGISPCDYIKAQQATYHQYENWSPENAGDEYEGKYSMEGAMTNSVNTVTVKLIQEAGIPSTIALVRSAGIDSDIPEVPSIALGTPSISLFEMVKAYSIFVNQGSYCEPIAILKITNQEGDVIYSSKTECKQTHLSPENAKMVRRMLETVVNEGTGQRLRTRYNLENDLAGKTGTTQNNADGWFMGLTPNLVTGTWVGADDPRIHFRSTALGQGANTALPIFGEFMTRLNQNPAYNHFTQAKFKPLPPDLEDKLACDPFREDVNFWQALFGKKDKEEKKYQEKKSKNEEGEKEDEKEKKGLWKRVKRLFGKD